MIEAIRRSVTNYPILFCVAIVTEVALVAASEWIINHFASTPRDGYFLGMILGFSLGVALATLGAVYIASMELTRMEQEGIL